MPAQFLASMEGTLRHVALPGIAGSSSPNSWRWKKPSTGANHKEQLSHADHLGIDVFTDTTERSPPHIARRRFAISMTTAATESWAFLFLPDDSTDAARANLLKRNQPRCLKWSQDEITQTGQR